MKLLKTLDLTKNMASERNAWKSAFRGMALVAFGLGAALSYQATHTPSYLVPYNLATSQTRVKVAPGGTDSTAYIGYLAQADVALITTWEPDNVGVQYSRFLNRTTPSLYASEQVKLTQEAEAHKAANESQTFYPGPVQIDAAAKTARVSGTLVRMQGEKQVLRQQVTYLIQYQESGGMFYVDSLSIQQK